MKTKRWDTVCSVCTAGVSVVCMSSMAAAGAAASAGVAGMASMGSMSGTGDAPGSADGLSFLPELLERLGLGLLNSLPNEILQPLLVVLLTVTVGAAYVGNRGHGRSHALVLSRLSAVIMYLSIYVWMSDLLYLVSLAGLVGAGLLGLYLARHPRQALGEPTHVQAT